MKRFIVVVLGTALMALGAPAVSDEYVRGYVKRDGTYVPPHYRSTPDSSRGNNWSSQGNVNPHTGERGTVNTPPPPPSYIQRAPSYPNYGR